MILYGYGSIPIHTIFNGMNIHLPAILMFTRGTRFWHTAIFFLCVSFQTVGLHIWLFLLVSFVGFWMFHLLDYYNCKRSFQPWLVRGASSSSQGHNEHVSKHVVPRGFILIQNQMVRPPSYRPSLEVEQIVFRRMTRTQVSFLMGKSHYSSKYAINGSKLRMQLDPPFRMEIHPGTHSDGTQIPQAAHTTTIPTRIPSGTGSDWEASMEMSIWSLVPEDWKTWNR